MYTKTNPATGHHFSFGILGGAESKAYFLGLKTVEGE
jgi:hypothetical protein